MEQPKEIVKMGNFEPGTTGGVGEGSSSREASATVTENGKLEVVVDSSVEPRETMLLPERRIERVPLALRKDEKTKGYFDPKVISIGPYHHEKPELLRIGKRIKPIIAKLYLPISTDRDMLCMKILEIVDVARSYYVEGSTNKYSNEEFAEMMLLDGLFLLAYLEFFVDNKCEIVEELITQLGLHDFFLADIDLTSLSENQLPFQVLELLLSLKSKDISLNQMWARYWGLWQDARSKALNMDFKWELSIGRIDGEKPLHFPEFCWLQQNKFIKGPIHDKFEFLYSFPNINSDSFYSFRSVSELKAKGIRIRSSSVYDRRNIEFRPFFFFFGLLEISPIVVDHHAIIHFSNQIAYEWMPHNPNKQPTMAYVNFLKSLINSTEDVKELRARNTLFSPCSSDEEVVRMINSIPTIPMEDFKIYAEVRQKIQKHYDNKMKTWIAELIHQYFSSPWTFISFLAAITLLISSILQTYLIANPPK